MSQNCESISSTNTKLVFSKCSYKSLNVKAHQSNETFRIENEFIARSILVSDDRMDANNLSEIKISPSFHFTGAGFSLISCTSVSQPFLDGGTQSIKKKIAAHQKLKILQITYKNSCFRLNKLNHAIYRVKPVLKTTSKQKTHG